MSDSGDVTVASAPPAVASTSIEEVAATQPSELGAKKRANPGFVDGQGNAKRRRADFAVGDRGVFYTTMSPSGAHNARRDLLRLLEEVLPENAADEAAAASSANAGLEAELQQLKGATPRFVTSCQEIAKGTGFVKFSNDMGTRLPSELVPRLLANQKAEFQTIHASPTSRLLCRVLPIDHTCRPFIDDFRKLAETVLPQHIGPEAKPTVWALEFRARNTNTLKKEAALEVIDALVAKDRHRVNLGDPEKCILVEVNPLFCGLSVLSRWAELKKYNLHALTTPEEARKAPPPRPAASNALRASVPGAAAAADSAVAAGAPSGAAAAPNTSVASASTAAESTAVVDMPTGAAANGTPTAATGDASVAAAAVQPSPSSDTSVVAEVAAVENRLAGAAADAEDLASTAGKAAAAEAVSVVGVVASAATAIESTAPSAGAAAVAEPTSIAGIPTNTAAPAEHTASPTNAIASASVPTSTLAVPTVSIDPAAAATLAGVPVPAGTTGPAVGAAL